jgi:hypothetical protein
MDFGMILVSTSAVLVSPWKQIGISEYGRVWAKYGQEWLAIAGRPLARFLWRRVILAKALS